MVATNTSAADNAAAATYSLTFNDKADFEKHTVIDANNDGDSWIYAWKKARCKYADASDDWLISEAFTLEGGKTYPFKAVFTGSSSSMVKAEVFAGQGNTVADMTITVLPLTQIKGSNVEVNGSLYAPVTGEYHLGFHAGSQLEYYLDLMSYEIGAPVSSATPAKVTDPVIARDEIGYLKAKVTCESPSQDVNGSDLTQDVTVKVYRGETMVHEETVTPGSEVEFEDIVPAAGQYTYTFIASTTDGESVPVTATAYVGPYKPGEFSDVSMIENTTGKIDLKWRAITTDAEGVAVPAANITYNLFEITYNEFGQRIVGKKINDEPISGTSYSYTVPDYPAAQKVLTLGMQAVNLGVAGDMIYPWTIIGTPYDMPVKIGRNADTDDYFLYFGGAGSAEFWTSGTMGITDNDGDGELLSVNNPDTESASFIQTGKINITGENPVFSFYLYPLAAEDMNQTQIAVIDGDRIYPLETVTNSDYSLGEWTRCVIDLSQFIGRTVQMRMIALSPTVAYNVYDNLREFDIRIRLLKDKTISHLARN